MNKRISWNYHQGKLPQGAVKVDRSTRYGNPYKVADYGRAEALGLYRAWLDEQLKRDPSFLLPLAGKDLACSCALSENCHADILIEKIAEIYG